MYGQPGAEAQGEAVAAAAPKDRGGDMRAVTDALLKRLPRVTTAPACDELAASLACVCSKAMRRRLV